MPSHYLLSRELTCVKHDKSTAWEPVRSKYSSQLKGLGGWEESKKVVNHVPDYPLKT